MRTSLKRINVNETVECKVLRIVNGKFGRQAIAEIEGVEYFLPSHTQLVRKIEETGIRKLVKITCTEAGNKTKETSYNIEIVDEV